MATRKFSRKPVDVREIGGVMGFLMSAFVDEVKKSGMPKDPVGFLHNMVHGSMQSLDEMVPPPSFENRELHYGLVDGIHGYMHYKGHDPHAHEHEHEPEPKA